MENQQKRVELIMGWKDEIDKEPENDYYLFQFICSVLDLCGEKDFLTENGKKMLGSNPSADITILQECPLDDKKRLKLKKYQQAFIRYALYLTIIYVAGELFIGFVFALDLPEQERFVKYFPPPLMEYLKTQKERIEAILPMIKSILDTMLGRLTDKYAKIFNQEKRIMFEKDIYKTELHIPTEIPEEANNAVQMA